MKKVFSFLAVLTVVAMFSSSAWAVFNSSTTVALATIPGGATEFSVQLYEWENTYSATTSTNTIHWDTLNTLVLSSGTAQFKCANVYALLKSTMTESNTKVLLYTDNFHNTLHPAISSNTTNKGRGLVDKKTGTKFAQLSYMCKKISVARESVTSLPADSWGNPSWGWDPADGVRVLFDKSDGEYSETNENAIIASTMGTVPGSESGVWFYSSATWGTQYTSEDVVMFFGAQFLSVLGGESYGTESITFEKMVE